MTIPAIINRNPLRATLLLSLLLTSSIHAADDLCPPITHIKSIALVRVGEPDRPPNASDPDTRALPIRNISCGTTPPRKPDDTRDTQTYLAEEFGIQHFDQHGNMLVHWDGYTHLMIITETSCNIADVQIAPMLPGSQTVKLIFRDRFAGAAKAFFKYHLGSKIAIVINDEVVQVFHANAVPPYLMIDCFPPGKTAEQLAEAINTRLKQ